jgi:hypothetical protein
LRPEIVQDLTENPGIFRAVPVQAFRKPGVLPEIGLAPYTLAYTR